MVDDPMSFSRTSRRQQYLKEEIVHLMADRSRV
jgi:hypothetical protein